jgi:hypothetical protein
LDIYGERICAWQRHRRRVRASDVAQASGAALGGDAAAARFQEETLRAKPASNCEVREGKETFRWDGAVAISPWFVRFL